MSRPSLTAETRTRYRLAGRRIRTRQVVLLRLAGISPIEIGKRTGLPLWRVLGLLRRSGGQTVGRGKLANFYITGRALSLLGCGIGELMDAGAVPWICGTDLFASRPLTT